MKSECAVRLELLFTEQLVQGGFLRKQIEPPLVVDQIIAFVAGYGRLDIKQDPGGAAGIADLSDRAMRTMGTAPSELATARCDCTTGFARRVSNACPGQIDQYPEIDPRHALQLDQGGERH